MNENGRIFSHFKVFVAYQDGFARLIWVLLPYESKLWDADEILHDIEEGVCGIKFGLLFTDADDPNLDLGRTWLFVPVDVDGSFSEEDVVHILDELLDIEEKALEDDEILREIDDE